MTPPAAASPPLQIPQTPAEIAAAAASRDLPVPDACLPGVTASLALLARHWRTMRGDGA